MAADGHGIARVKSDDLEAKEARLTMFQVPHHLPVGRQRAMMGDSEYMRRAAPALADAYAHEQGVKDIISQQGRDPHGGHQISAIVFNQQKDKFQHADNWGADRVRNVDPNAHKANYSQLNNNIFDDAHAGQLVTGQYDPSGGYQKGALRPHGMQQQRQQAPGAVPHRGFVPSSRILGADEHAKWTVDRDQRLNFAADPYILAQAAKMAEDDKVVCDANRAKSRLSAVPFGDYDLNPQRKQRDDYGVDRLRSDFAQAPVAHQVASLLADPPPNSQQSYQPSTNVHAGKGTRSTVFDNVPEPRRQPGPFAGRRAASTALNENAGPPAPVPPPGSYISHDAGGAPKVAYNRHGGRATQSSAMEGALAYDPHGQAAEVSAAHLRRREMKPSGARQVPLVEDIVFDGQAPLTSNAPQTHSEVTHYAAPPEGKRGAKDLPPEALRAAQTNINAREFGGEASAAEAAQDAARRRPVRFNPNKDMLTYTEYDQRQFDPEPRYVPFSQVGDAMNGGDVAANAYSAEPRGLPRRHPGPERLKRGRGIDGAGHDHQGRQLATSLVDEVIFGRSNFQGKLALAQHGANFAIDMDGNFAHR